MISKNKALVVFLLVSLSSAYFFSKIFIIDGFEDPTTYRITYIFIKIISGIAKLGDALGVYPECYILRFGFNSMFGKTVRLKEPIKVYDTRMSGLNVRVYTPDYEFDSPLPFMVYIHGGGFVIATLEFHDAYLYQTVKNINMTVISIEYRKSPDHPFPIPVDDCWSIVQHLMKNPTELNLDPSRMVLSGDSAGGNVALVLTQRLIRQKMTLPKLQLLIYPWVQMVTLHLPSYIEYYDPVLASLSLDNLVLWYLGYERLTAEMNDVFRTNDHLLLLDDATRARLAVYLNVSLIHENYTVNRPYHTEYRQRGNDPLRTLSKELSDTHILKRDKQFASRIQQVFSDEVSPSLADASLLAQYPTTYQIVCEWDAIRDEQLIFFERMKRAGVRADLAFYQKCHHGSVTNLDTSKGGYAYSAVILNDTISYLKRELYT